MSKLKKCPACDSARVALCGVWDSRYVRCDECGLEGTAVPVPMPRSNFEKHRVEERAAKRAAAHWNGCKLYEIEAMTGSEAKRKAKQM